jgi:transposase-like protein
MVAGGASGQILGWKVNHEYYNGRQKGEMSRSTISTFQVFELFPDQHAARKYLENRLWPNGPICPACKSGERITARATGGFKRCNACKFDFTVRTDTIFGRSHVPLHKWLYAMYLLVTARKGISSIQLAKEIGITQKSAWFVLHRLREACGGSGSQEIQYAQAGPANTGSFFAALKRGLYGIYHRPSSKHMPRYVNEVTFRLNEGNVKRQTLERLDSFVDAVVGKRITYKDLTGTSSR